MWPFYDTRYSDKIFKSVNLAKKYWASIQYAEGRLTARSREVSKPRDSGLDISNRFEVQLQNDWKCLNPNLTGASKATLHIYMQKVRLGISGMYDNTGFDEKK